jgi:hypothetical protein
MKGIRTLTESLSVSKPSRNLNLNLNSRLDAISYMRYATSNVQLQLHVATLSQVATATQRPAQLPGPSQAAA